MNVVKVQCYRTFTSTETHGGGRGVKTRGGGVRGVSRPGVGGVKTRGWGVGGVSRPGGGGLEGCQDPGVGGRVGYGVKTRGGGRWWCHLTGWGGLTPLPPP